MGFGFLPESLSLVAVALGCQVTITRVAVAVAVGEGVGVRLGMINGVTVSVSYGEQKPVPIKPVLKAASVWAN